MNSKTDAPLSVVHVLRTPVGGLFRHVCDLARSQAAMGLNVGIFCDSTTGGENADVILEELASLCTLGICRVPIGRLPGFADYAAMKHLRTFLKSSPTDILHGHGAKGGAYARLVGSAIEAKSFYTPHGGSLHYNPRTPAGFVFLKLEQWLSGRTNGIIFESAFSQAAYHNKIGTPACPARVIHNGIGEDDFKTRPLAKDAADFVFIGELRKLKGVDLLLHALAKITKSGKTPRCVIVGDGPDAAEFRELSRKLDLDSVVKFAGFKAASKAFSYGKILVIPSRAESFPYIILEGAAANLPIITTHVGGIPEIFGEQTPLLISPDSVSELTDSLEFALSSPEKMAQRADILHARVKEKFSVSAMTEATVAFYKSV